MRIILIFKPKGYGVEYEEQYIRFAYYESSLMNVVDIFDYTKSTPKWKRYYKFD